MAGGGETTGLSCFDELADALNYAFFLAMPAGAPEPPR